MGATPPLEEEEARRTNTPFHMRSRCAAPEGHFPVKQYPFPKALHPVLTVNLTYSVIFIRVYSGFPVLFRTHSDGFTLYLIRFTRNHGMFHVKHFP